MSVCIPELDAFTTDDLESTRKLSEIREFLRSVDDPFDRARGPQHMTCSAIVVSTAGVLLHKHKLSGLWIGPGGHIDAGEQPAVSILREVLEETGVQAAHPHNVPTLLAVDIHKTSNQHIHLDLTYVLIAPPTDPNPPEGESPDVAWFEPFEAEALTDGSHAAAIAQLHKLDLLLP